MPWKPFSSRSAGSKDFDLAKITFQTHDAESQHRQESLRQRRRRIRRASAAPATSVIPTEAPSPPASRTRTATSTRMSKTGRIPRARRSRTFRRTAASGGRNNGDGTFGNRTFNTPSVVEAADTAPFFHNNVEGILQTTSSTSRIPENAVRFYIGPEFNNPRAPAARFSFNDTQIDQLVAFLQGLNTLQNIDIARRELAEILANNGNPRREQDTRLQTAFDETQDAIDVLTAGNLYPTAKTHLIAARNFISQAQVTESPSQRRPLIQQAIAKLDAAKNAVATIAP